MHYFFKDLVLLWDMIQTNKVHSNDDKGKVYRNYEFQDPQGRGPCARAWPYKSLYWVRIIFYCINIQHIDCYSMLFLCQCWFLFSMLLICKYESFWWNVSAESLILRWPLNLRASYYKQRLGRFYKCNIEKMPGTHYRELSSRCLQHKYICIIEIIDQCNSHYTCLLYFGAHTVISIVYSVKTTVKKCMLSLFLMRTTFCHNAF